MKLKTLASLASAVCAGMVHGATCTYDGAWDTAPTSAEDDIVITSGTLTWDTSLPATVKSWTQSDGTVTFKTTFPNATGVTAFPVFEVTGDVTLTGGTWTHTENSNKEQYRLYVTCGGDFTVASNAVIHADGKGYVNAGPGYCNSHSGGAYGGYCERTASVTVYGRCYGSVASPENIGSGKGRNGGGAIRLDVAGTLTVDGKITSSGTQTVENYYGGSGGSVWLSAAKIAGAAYGAIRADGSITKLDYPAGGGRVSLCQTGSATDFSELLGTVTADGSRKDTGAYSGTPGTVYYELAADGRGKGAIEIDAHNAAYVRSEFFLAEQDAGFAPKSVAVRNGADLRVHGDDVKGAQTFKVTASVVLENKATIHIDKGASFDIRNAAFAPSGSGDKTLIFGTDTAFLTDADCELNGATVRLDGSGFDWALDTLVCTNGGGLLVKAASELDIDTLTIANGGVVTTDYPLSITGDMVVDNGGKITHTANTKDTDYRVDITVGGDFTVNAGGAIDTLRKGFPYQSGPGTDTAVWMSSSHGGRGWSASYVKPSAGHCYGSLTRPTTLGSGVNNSGTYPATGGGAVKLTVGGAFVNNGAVNADGGSGDYQSAPGGSVWITAATISGAGRITANGHGETTATRISLNELSGGGRVSLWETQTGADFSSYTGPITAFGARNASKAGGAGTVYLKTGDQAADEGTLIISNATSFVSCETEISANVTDLTVGSIVVASGSVLKLVDGQVLNVKGNVTNLGTISSDAASGLQFTGSGTSVIDGSFTIGVFDCLMPGKSIVFTPGTTLGVMADGRFKIEGDAEHPVSLASATAESAWNLNVDATAAVAVNAAAVTDCDASAGQRIAAVNSELVRTENWSNTVVVYGQTVTWTGATGGSGWLTAGNWDVERAPLATDRIVIPSTTVQPVLAAAADSLDLTIEPGAVLDLAGHDYTVTEDFRLAGTLKSSGSPVVTVNGDCDLSGGRIDSDELKLVLAGGSAAQNFGGGDILIPQVVLRPGAAGLAVTNGFTAYSLVMEAEAARQISFTPGITVAARLAFDVDSTGSALTLASATPGQTWNLALAGTVAVSGVTVSDSAVSGTIVLAADSTDGGNNANWDFGTISPFHWTATATSPAATDAAYVDSTLTAATGDLEVRSLVLKAGAAFTLPRASTLTVTESLIVEDGATATLNGKVTVGGSFQIASGATVNHSQTTAANTVYSLDVTVCGDFVLEAGATIDLYGKGYKSTLGPGGTTSGGGSHAGRGESHNMTHADKTYGSIMNPVLPGSGGNNTAGGGAVKLVVGGNAILNGLITVKGVNHENWWTGAGGSVWLTAAALIGSGEINADGGDLSQNYTGSGGRISVKLTSAGATIEHFLGSIHAYSGWITGTLPYPRGSAGTVYYETAADRPDGGKVIIDNSASGTATGWNAGTERPYTDYPVTNDNSVPQNEAAKATVVLRNKVNLNITADCRIGDLVVEGTKPKVYLNGHTLKINANKPADWPTDGSYPSWVVRGGTEEEPGKIVWRQGLVVIIK